MKMSRIVLTILFFSCSFVHAQEFTYFIDGVHLECVFKINEQEISEGFLLKNETNESI